ncbi:hypothetical protein ES703_53127 [subsurface metagenome]
MDITCSVDDKIVVVALISDAIQTIEWIVGHEGAECGNDFRIIGSSDEVSTGCDKVKFRAAVGV